MRKIFTLLAALVTLVSVAAGPQFVKKTNITKKAPVHVRHITLQSGQKPGKVALTTSKVQAKKMSLGMTSKVLKAAQAYELTYSELTYEDYGYGDTWFSITTNDGGYRFFFDILKSVTDLEVGKTYTMADCDPDFSYIQDNSTYAMIKYTDLSLVLSKGDDGKFLVEAQCATENGDTYHLKYAPVVRPDVFNEVTLSDMPLRFYNFTKASGLFQFTAKNDVYDMGICVKSNSKVEGTWVTADMDQTYTYLSKNGKNIKLWDVELNVAALEGNNYHVEAKMYAYDGNVYIINRDYVEPTKQNTANIVATNLAIDEEMFEVYKNWYGYGVADITASTDDYSISGSLLSYTTIAGHYDDYNHMLNELFITNNEGKKTDFFTSELDVQQVEGSWTLKGKVLCWDNTEYTLDLSFTIPEIKGEKSFTSTNGELEDQTAESGAFRITALDESYNDFTVILPASYLASGHFSTLPEEYKNYCSIYYDSKTYKMFSADFDLVVDGQNFTLKGKCQGGDQLWTVDIAGVILAKTDPYDATAEDGDVDVKFSLDDITEFEINAEKRYAYLEVMNKERNDVWTCMFNIDGDKLPAGEYPIDLSYMPGTVQPGEIYEGDLYPTTYFRLNEVGYASLPVWYCSEGTVKVDYDSAGNIVVDCNAYNSNYVSVHVTVNAQSTGINQVVNGKVQKNGKFIENNRVVIRSHGQKFNTFGQQLK